MKERAYPMGKKVSEEKTLSRGGIAGLVIFYFSFIPYLILVWAAVAGTDTFFGGDAFKGYVYGFKAVEYMGLLFSTMLPVYPVCLVYQILFGLLYIIRRPREIKRPAGIYAGVFVLLILIPCLVYSGRELVYYSKNVHGIREMLSLKYGEEVAADCKIRLDDMEDEEFCVYSPLLLKDRPFTVSRNREGDFDDHGYLILEFENENEGFREDLNRYADKKFDMPSNMHLEAYCENIDFGGYKYGDDYSSLIPSAEYSVFKMYVELEDADQETLEKLLVSIWEEQCPKFADLLDSSLVIIVSVKGQAVANMQITMPIPENHNLPVGSIGVLDAGREQYGLCDKAFYI